MEQKFHMYKIIKYKKEGGSMGKVCNWDCFNCIHSDCINDRAVTQQERERIKKRDINFQSFGTIPPGKKKHRRCGR